MNSETIREKVLAIALCAISVCGTLALFESVPLIAQMTQPKSILSTQEAQQRLFRSDS